ncbi:caspase-1-like isoform X2 [Rhinatrema bivittatum]|uniref:caspase-1-like isoform X2 n=1 Tax=Rhinatrema bivittatum TaxID=194408 RepID=UPI00112EBD62|nr:caspase-1-like isoform X2 [Rhinatrema bivittatum]
MAAKKLSEKRPRFVSRCNLAVLTSMVDDLQSFQILNSGEAEHITESTNVTREKARSLIDFIIKKGEAASSAFIQCLQEHDRNLCTELGFCTPSETQELPALSQEEVHISPPAAPSTAAQVAAEPSGQAPVEEDWITLCSLQDIQRIQREEAEDIYTIGDKASRTRLALIICNEIFKQLPRREGAKEDESGMKKLLTGLGYRVEIQRNLSSEVMERSLKEFSCCTEHVDSDSTFIVLMSHGVRKGLCGVNCTGEDTDILSLDTIFQIFNNKSCRALMGKPKVLLIQACRGEKMGRTWVSDSVSSPSVSDTSTPSSDEWEDDALRAVHIESDFICFFSSTPGEF